MRSKRWKSPFAQAHEYTRNYNHEGPPPPDFVPQNRRERRALAAAERNTEMSKLIDEQLEATAELVAERGSMGTVISGHLSAGNKRKVLDRAREIAGHDIVDVAPGHDSSCRPGCGHSDVSKELG
jgi:hypothetical protein